MVDERWRGGRERPRINVNDPYELQDWAFRFNATDQQIRDAVAAVGEMVEDVRAYLKKKSPGRGS